MYDISHISDFKTINANFLHLNFYREQMWSKFILHQKKLDRKILYILKNTKKMEKLRELIKFTESR